MSELATVTLDVSGLPCPAPLLGAKKLIDDLQPGQTLRLISDCPGTADDLFAWAKVTGNVVLGSQKQADGKTAYLIQRAGSASATPMAHVTLDMRGVSCPGPIVQAKKLLDGMKAGEVLQLVSDCPGSADDITSWARAGAADLVFSHESGRGVHEFYLRRK
ncbi:sulfurtransferase TusA family protein [Sulfuritalea hydrogenivorans]|jgi:TusA-related sulfurtransferase|uniref:SirA family protein n=1 Tax=Sulfuritalea hydrogenivorans sk43H TaxID=1223802 RepID=W0SDV5_9PROT|nr:sulfurtransferase TusA family protein [Sulfuritalea hydrogenivorans]BAO29246.1 SirA family protein [Sulfuritalea hydrogenivorans sk43H]